MEGGFRMIWKIVRVISCSLLVMSVFLIGGILYFSKPWISVSEVRATDNLETILALYGRACEEDFLSEFKNDESLGRLTLVLPEGGVGPEDTEAVVPDNVFEITGYRYKKVRRNLLSGEIEEVPSRRFDVIEWRAIVSYSITDKHANISQVDTPLRWRSPDPEPVFIFNEQEDSDGC